MRAGAAGVSTRRQRHTPNQPFHRPAGPYTLPRMTGRHTPDFNALLQRLDRPARLPGLARALGFEPVRDADAAAGGAAAGWRTLGRRHGARLLVRTDRTEPPGGDLAADVRQTAGTAADLHTCFLLADARCRRLTFACLGIEGDLRTLTIDRSRPTAADIETLAELAARPGDGAAALALRYTRALDRVRVSQRFFHDVRGLRARVAAAWTGVPRDRSEDRAQLALLLICRMMFLYFLQSAGRLGNGAAFLHGLVRNRPRNGEGGVYRSTLIPLFFQALNTRPAHRSAAARRLGPLPYLNGGLFEPHAAERRWPDLDLPDAVIRELFEAVLERYRFTAREPADLDCRAEAGIDPEMLGRIFEGVMDADRRGATGTFFTPARTVEALVASTLARHVEGLAGTDDAARIMHGECARLPAARRSAIARALARTRVLDPACGSGAFLLGTLAQLARIRAGLEGRNAADVRREIVADSLHGVDIQSDAALLCALRLWLALAADVHDSRVRPLPNLDRRIRQGDALLDPLDLARPRDGDAERSVARDPAVRAAIRRLMPAARAYLGAGPGRRDRLRRELAALETGIARAWVDALERRLRDDARRHEADAAERDLWNAPTTGARRARTLREATDRRGTELAALRRRLEDAGATPFFSFPIHFATADREGFDIIVSNPPWIRAHRWPDTIRRIVRRRFRICRTPGWPTGSRLASAPAAAAAQTDLALLFLERAVELLGTGGTLGMLLPAKMLRSMYGGPARRMLLEATELLDIEDHGLDHRTIFRADAFAAAIIARRSAPAPAPDGNRTPRHPAPTLRVTLHRRGRAPLRFSTRSDRLPLLPGDPDSPWLLAPPATVRALRRMQRAGPPIGLHDGLRTRRGVFTGANDVFIVREARPRLAGLATIRAEGAFRGNEHARNRRAARGVGPAVDYEATIEDERLAALVRGADIDAWRWHTRRFLIWCHDRDGRPVPPPPYARRYLDRHADRLDRRSRPGTHHPRYALFRVPRATTGHRVAWHDLADTLRATTLPPAIRTPIRGETPVVPLNTVYYIPAPDYTTALILTAFLNATPVRTFARAIAERAKDARFRFFAWTVGALPLPADWHDRRRARPLLRIATAAHADRGIDNTTQQRLDTLVAHRYALTDREARALGAFAAWLDTTRP
jgi:hypothetical protein